jgi:hypothetical protein
MWYVDKLFETIKKIYVHVLPCTLIIHSTITKEKYDEELRGAPMLQDSTMQGGHKREVRTNRNILLLALVIMKSICEK